MKNSKRFISRLFVYLVTITFTLISCSNNDDEFDKPLIPLFSESDFSMIHNDSEKKWQITEVINTYYNPNYHLEIELSCLEDDVYTFKSDKEVDIDLGDSRCFGKNDDGIFTADIEIFKAKLLYMKKSDSDDKTIFLEFARGFENNDSTAGGISLRWYKLAELTENRMVFHRAGGKFIGEYKQALIFEKI